METNMDESCITCTKRTSLASLDIADVGQCKVCYKKSLGLHFQTRVGLPINSFRTDINRLMKAGKWGTAQRYLKIFIDSNSKVFLDSYERLYK